MTITTCNPLINIGPSKCYHMQFVELKWAAILTLKQTRLGAETTVSGSPFPFGPVKE